MLRKIFKIAGKEFSGLFASPAAFLFLAAFLGVTLFVFFWVSTFFARNIADVQPLFRWMPVLLIFLVGAVTMRSWAEERRSGTLELLLTSPTGLTEHVLGKFLGTMGLVLVALLLTLPLPITVAFIGPLDWGPVIGGYVAAALLASAYVSIGLWVSSRTDNQIVSLITTTLITGVFYLIGSNALTSLFSYNIADWLRAFGAGSRFDSITRGVLDLRDLYYYLSITVTFLVLNRLSLEKLRWANNTGQPRHRYWYWVAALLSANALGANLWLGQITSARVDLTAGHLYTLSNTTRNYLAQLREPLLIRGYFSAKTHPLLAPLVPQLRNLLEEYAVAGGSRVHVEFVDPTQNQNVAAQAASRYGIQPVPFEVPGKYQTSVVNSYFDILVKYGNQYQVLGFRKLINFKQRSETQLSVALDNPEYQITSAIRQVLLDYDQGGNPFSALAHPVVFTGYISGPDVLPAQLRRARAALTAALDKLGKQAGDRLKIEYQDPGANPALATRLTKQFGFRPMELGLLEARPFWFYMTLGDGTETEPVPLPRQLDEASFERALKAGVERFSPGFLKTVAVLAGTGGTRVSGAHETFATLYQTLNDQVHWINTKLSDGRVPSQADMLMVLDPENLDTKQVFAIDQFLMRGGTIMIASSPTQVSVSKTISGSPVHSGLKDWLAHFGLSLGSGLVLDPSSGALPIPVERNVGGVMIQQLELARYPYIVDVRGSGLNQTSPITRNLGQIDLPWAAPVRVNEKLNRTRKVTYLLRSSPQSWISSSGNLLPDYGTYPQLGFAEGSDRGSRPLAVMLEGQFTSAFAGQRSPLLPAPTAAKPGASAHAAAKHARTVARDPGTHAKKAAKPAPPPVIGSVIEHSPSTSRLILIGSSAMFTDAASGLIGEAQGTIYRKPEDFAENLIDWALEDQGLLAIRGRDQYARTLAPLTRTAEQFWEYGNYAVALGGLALVWLLNRRRRRRLVASHLQLLEGV